MPPLIDASVDLDFLERSPSTEDEAGKMPAIPFDAAQDKRTAGFQPALENGAYIPYSYVDDENLRVQLYGRISSLATESEVRELMKEFADRFGKLPSAMRNLFEIARIRIAAAYADVKTVRVNEGRIILIRNNEPIMPDGRYPRLTATTTPTRLKEILQLLKGIRTTNEHE